MIAKMLFVDDDIFFLRMVAVFMKGYFQVAVAGSAEEGLKQMELLGPFDIVISDYNMPGMNGVEFLRLVAERWPKTIRILTSGGGADMDLVEREISAGIISRFLAKPFCVISLRDQLAGGYKGGAAPLA